jgi:putative ATPase
MRRPIRRKCSILARMDLFEAAGLPEAAPRPLADRLRPQRLEDVVGQDHLLGPTGPIGRMLAKRRLGSMILWGPPGVGKTTIARLLAKAASMEFAALSAVFTGVADLKKVFEAARARRAAGQSTVLFVDEIHRFNRAQQDGFLPFVEEGVVSLVGATTENPSFELNGALLSRCQVFTLNALEAVDLERLLARAEALLDRPLPVSDAARALLCAYAQGDGRYLLTLAEAVFAAAPEGALLEEAEVAQLLQRRAPAYDKDREAHYNLISALHKAIRASDPDAALYWLARMLQGGEPPLFIARRLVRAAAEDIGAADPLSLLVANAAKDAVDFIGQPEAELHLAQAVLHLASAPKSNAVYVAWKAASRAAAQTNALPPPMHIRNAPTALMKQLGYSAGYAYDHNAPEGFSGQNCFPDDMARARFYEPTDRGAEAKVAERLARWRAARGD